MEASYFQFHKVGMRDELDSLHPVMLGWGGEGSASCEHKPLHVV